MTSSNALELQVAVQKINKYATSESGDTVEIVERPNGGISVVMADGQRSGRSAKTISNIVVRKAISLIAEGVRDGAVARATHDYLRTHRGGKVSAELVIISVDLNTNSVVMSRNGRCPILVRLDGVDRWYNCESDAIGIYRNTKPSIDEIAIQPNLTIAAFTDGVWHSGGQTQTQIDIPEILDQSDQLSQTTAGDIADSILQCALKRDSGRPRDDAATAVIRFVSKDPLSKIRSLAMTIPIQAQA